MALIEISMPIIACNPGISFHAEETNSGLHTSYFMFHLITCKTVPFFLDGRADDRTLGRKRKSVSILIS